ncbi:MAG: hypothetical protein LUH22_09130 [Bacteroides sp.]|nr:hypothetical protein [Bacteroides sp.]
MKINPYIFAFFMFVSLILVVMPTMPHHHHSDGRICMLDDIQADDCCTHHHPHHHPYDDPCCTGDCLTQIIKAEVAHQDTDLIQAAYIHTITLFSISLLKYLTPPLEIPDFDDYVYRESLHSTFITRAVGLRAPPSLV